MKSRKDIYTFPKHQQTSIISHPQRSKPISTCAYPPMNLSSETLFLLGSVLIFISILVSKTGSRFGIPTLLLFLFTGMAFGSDGLGMQFDSYEDAQFIGMIALSVILFTGGIDTKVRDIRPITAPGIVLSTLGVVMTTAITGAFTYALNLLPGFNLQLSLTVAMLLAATMSSTDSASVFNLLRSQGIGLKHNLRPLLELESGSNDPMAYMLTLAFIQVIATESSFTIENLLTDLGMQFALGGLLGYFGGRFCVWLVNRVNLPNPTLYPIFLLSLCFIIFTLTDQIKGNGYLAVYIAGLVVGNNRLSYRKEMTTFMEGITSLVQIIMFLSLGLLVNPSELLEVAIFAIIIGVFMMLVARPLTVFLCLAPFRNIPGKAKLFTSWVGLRGAVPILFATYPVLHNIEGAQIIFNIVFFITILSLIFQGMTISTFARWLHLDTPPEKNGNEFGIELPEELPSTLQEIVLTEENITEVQKLKAALARHEKDHDHTQLPPARLSDFKFPAGTLVMLIKRDSSIIVPNGKIEVHPKDILLTITHDSQQTPQ